MEDNEQVLRVLLFENRGTYLSPFPCVWGELSLSSTMVAAFLFFPRGLPFSGGIFAHLTLRFFAPCKRTFPPQSDDVPRAARVITSAPSAITWPQAHAAQCKVGGARPQYSQQYAITTIQFVQNRENLRQEHKVFFPYCSNNVIS